MHTDPNRDDRHMTQDASGEGFATDSSDFYEIIDILEYDRISGICGG